MDSPDAADKIASASKTSPSKDSPFYNYLSNLSPINQTKDTRVGQRLFHVSSPPPVFTSPREPKLLERLQNSETATAGLLTIYRTDGEIPSISQSTMTEAQVMLIPYTEVFNKVVGDAENQSPPSSIDKYLADPSEECGNFLCSPNLCTEKVAELPQIFKPSAKCGEERCFKNDVSENNQTDGNIEADLQSSSVENTPESSLKGNLLADANPNKSAGDCFVTMDQIIDKGSTKIVQHMGNDNILEAGSSHLSASAENRYLKGTTAIVICGNECDKEMHAASPSTHMSCAHEVQVVKVQKNDMNSQGNLELDMVPCSDLLQNIELDRFSMDKVEMEAQRGARRRCLQFQPGGRNVAKIKSSGFSTVPPNVFQETSSPTAPEALEINPCEKIDGAVGNVLVAYSCQRAVSATELHASSAPQNGNKGANFSTDIRASSSVGTPIPLGIGLHLNSIGKAGVSMNVQKGQHLSERSHPFTEDSKGLLAGTSLRNNSSQIIPHDLKSVSDSPRLNISELSLAPTKKKEPAETDFCKVEDIDGMSPKKKRKRSAYSSGDEGCRRCNCKKSKCLKLYCECFAAGVYCSDPCTCQDCFNKPEYEDTVLGTRQQIESRNPLAFAPRVVHCVIGSPQNVDEEGTRTTPASARHKRGCNCKKSMCLKKYCECFQAGVGCSDGCRCEGCKNVFGRKEGLGIISYDHLKTESMRWNREAKGKLESADTACNMEPLAANDDMLQLEHCPMDPPSPRPLFRCSNREIVLPRTWQHSRRHLASSPDSESSAASSFGKSPNSPMKSSLSVRIVKTSVYVEDVDIQMPAKGDTMASSWNGLIDRCNVLPTRDYQSMRATPGSNPCLRSSQSMHGHVRLSKAHDSPITPISQSCETKYVGPSEDSSSKNLDDETPEILKETRSPIKAVKASSPNQKRVSPPHECLQGLRPTTSSSLRSGRRFILQSVPSFPPLTPYSNSKEKEK